MRRTVFIRPVHAKQQKCGFIMFIPSADTFCSCNHWSKYRRIWVYSVAMPDVAILRGACVPDYGSDRSGAPYASSSQILHCTVEELLAGRIRQWHRIPTGTDTTKLLEKPQLNGYLALLFNWKESSNCAPMRTPSHRKKPSAQGYCRLFFCRLKRATLR